MRDAKAAQIEASRAADAKAEREALTMQSASQADSERQRAREALVARREAMAAQQAGDGTRQAKIEDFQNKLVAGGPHAAEGYEGERKETVVPEATD